MKSTRIEWIDYTKGLTILTVILCHTLSSDIPYEKFIKQFFYSFHMPVFFILSCITFKFSQNTQEFLQKTHKSFKHLIIPVLLIFALKILITISHNPSLTTKLSFWIYQIERLLYTEACYSATGPFLGMLWFLIVLFLGRTAFDFIHMKLNKLNLALLTLIGTIIGILGSKTKWYFAFDIALGIFPFFYCGYKLKNLDIDDKTKQHCILYFILFIIAFLATRHDIWMSIACRSYAVEPMYYFTGIFGTLSLGYLCQILVKTNTFTFLSYLGKNSLYLLCIHIMDHLFHIIYNIPNSNIIKGLTRISLDILILVILTYIIQKYKTKNLQKENKN